MASPNPRSLRILLRILPVILLAACWPLAVAAEAEENAPTIFKWVDEHGIAHYTTDRDKIPRAIRNRIQRVAPAPVSAPPPALVGPPPEQIGGQDAPEAWAIGNAERRLSRDEFREQNDGLEAEDVAELSSLDGEISDLENEIAAGEERLLALLGTTPGASENELADDPEFRDIAERLPAMQADLEALRVRRGELAPAP